ncbi:MAG: YciI family protein [Chitinophagaceae bacterium]
MIQYVIIAKDGTDEGAHDRRMEVRPSHLEGLKVLKASNNFISGGATLDENGKMNGSVMIIQFETQDEFDAWYKTEPYITQKVWQDVHVRPFRVAMV